MNSITTSRYSGIYRLESRQLIQQPLDIVWDYFSRPENLQELTPKDLDFTILSPLEAQMYPGQIIVYKIGILPMLKSTWVTEITHVEENVSFVDEQRFGPYTLWHHRHAFQETAEGIVMTDIVHFKLPFGVTGRLFYPLIRKKLFKIFKFRIETIEKRFNSQNANK